MSAAPLTAAQSKEKPLVKYYRSGMSTAMHGYNEALIHLALDSSRSEFGDYDIEYYTEKLSPARSKVETERNNLLNVNIAGSWRGPHSNADNVFQICHSQYNNLMGLRGLLIRADDQAVFQKTKTVLDLIELRAIQDKSWPDGKILQHNGIQPQVFVGMNNLLRTLANSRVDYLPLSVLEISRLLDQNKKLFPNLAISEDVLLFYPHPGCIYVSKKTPEIAARMEQGIRQAKQDGSMETLFTEYFGDVESHIKSRQRITFILENPYLDDAANKKAIAEFLERYGEYVEAVVLSRPQKQ